MPNPTTGLTSAPRLVESASNVLHSLTQYRAFPASGTSSALAYSPAVLSAYVQQSTRRYIALRLRADSGGANGATLVFDTQAGAITYQANDGAGATRTVGFEAAGGAWWRVWVAVSGITPSAGWEGSAIVCNASTVPAAYLGDGTSGIFATGLQLEPGTAPGEYLGTTSVSIDDRFTAAGSYAFSISATNRLGTATRTFAQTVVGAAGQVAPVIVTSSLPAATVGAAYSQTLSITGTVTSVSLIGTLPPGLTFNASSRTIIGTPSVAGAVSVVVSAANAFGTAQQPLVLTVNPVAPSAIVGAWGKSLRA